MRSFALISALFLVFLLSAGGQERPDIPPGSGYLGYRVEGGDTVYFDSIDPIWIFPKGTRRSSKGLKEYYRLVYNFNKVYPYALIAKDVLASVDKHIDENNLRRRKRERYISQMQKAMFEAYEKPLRSMSIRQGQLLIRLVDREVGKSGYNLIKEYKSGLAAGFWQGIAKVFGSSLKTGYDPKGEDKMTEYLVEKWQRGEFDALYYSIFWEYPKHPKLVSKTQ